MMTKILVIDDEPNVREIIWKILEEENFQVIQAENGQIALELAPQKKPNLILCDVMMPGIDGFTVLKQLRKNPVTETIPFIFITAKITKYDMREGMNLGADDYITKPFTRDELLNAVNTRLGKRATFQRQSEQMTQQLSIANQQLNKYSQELESKVQERTKELSTRTQEVVKLMAKLQSAETQLTQAEKLSALGQLLAEIAHEINNPTNFIYGNIAHAEDYTQDCLQLIKLYQKHYPNPVGEIAEFIEEIELDYLTEDYPNIIQSMKIGASRIKEIVKSLKTVSRLDEAKVKNVNIHQGIDSTLMILDRRLSKRRDNLRIQVIKEYGELPLIDCYAGQLNQVFMNLIGNAIDALETAAAQVDIDDKKIYHNRWIKIVTFVKNNSHISIVIADNGCGIPKENQSQLFEPFFTTKPVGKGTGLGLSISYSIIVEKHGGTLTVNSSPGAGTEFRIEIPINS